MACVLTTGFTLDCKDNVGGIKNIYLLEWDAVSSYTKTAGEISAMTLDGGKSFFKYELPKGTGNMTMNAVTSADNGTTFYEAQVQVILHKLSTASRNEIKLLAQNRCALIVLDNNGVYWACGLESGCDMTGGEGATGTAYGDRNGWQLTFLHREADFPAKVQASVVTSLGL